MAAQGREGFVVRFRVIAAGVFVLTTAAGANAQSSDLMGWITGHLGQAMGGDLRDRRVTPGVSLAVIEDGGIGAELDLARTEGFADRFAESSITTLMLNAIGTSRHPMYKPFGFGGVGIMRVRASVFEGVPALSRTALGVNAGGGMLVLFNETIGVRGEVRYFRYVQQYPELPAIGALDFWRVSIGATYAWPIR